MADETYLHINPFHVRALYNFQLHKLPGRHVICSLQALLTQEDGENDQKQVNAETEITVSLADGTKLFQGVLISAEFIDGSDGIVVQVSAASHTCLLDEKRVSRSYQDINMTYQDIISKHKESYPDLDCIYSLEKDAAIGQFTLQYRETDWTFINRMASRLHIPVIAEAVSDKITYYFGVPKGKKISIEENILKKNYQIEYAPEILRHWNENETESVSEKAVVEYSFQIELDDSVALGDRLSFDGKSLLVKRSETYSQGGVLTHQIICAEEDGFFTQKRYNPLIAGLNLKGRVSKAVEDKLEMHIYEVDDKAPEKPYPFVYMTMYAAEGNGGWYFMPEPEDTVFIHFPTEDEKDAVAEGSIRTAEEKEDQVQNPEIKYIRTADGQEIKLTKDDITISTKEKGLYIRISEKDGIEISSHKAISIKSEKEIQMSAKSKLEIQAKEELKLVGKSCEITMGATMEVKGNVKIN